MKKMLSTLLCLALILSAMPVFALSVSAATSGDYTYSVSNDKATITKYNGVGGDIIIPDSLGKYPVTNINYEAFYNCTSVTSIVIPDSVTYIGGFEGCTSLKRVVLSSNLTSISDFAFYDCKSLESINIPNKVKSIGEYSFINCASLVDITIPNSVKEIGSCAFYGCRSLNNIYITDIVHWCNLDFMTVAYSDKNGTEYMVSNPLYYADNLYLNNELITDIVIPEGVTKIGNYVFSYYDRLNSITIPESVTSIGYGAFKNCTSLNSITICNSNIDIKQRDTIPISTTIHGYAGSTAHKYAETYGNEFSMYIPDDAVKGTCGNDVDWCINNDTDTLVLFGTGATYDYDNGNNKNPFIEHRANIKSIIIGDGITHLGNRLFRGVTQAESIIFGANIATMGYEVFYNCLKLKDVTLNEGLTKIGALAFYGCKNVTQISIPSTVTAIENRAFKGSGLTSIVVPDTVNSLGYEVFMNCANLESVDYTNSVSMLNSRMFENCTSLKNFYFTDNMCRIRTRAFYGCTALERITFENANEMWGSSNGQEAKIASNAFEGCNSTLQLVATNNSHVETYAARFGFTFVEK